MKRLLRLVSNIFKHKCNYINSTQRQLDIMYSNSFIIYNESICKCGNIKRIKLAGNLNIKDI